MTTVVVTTIVIAAALAFFVLVDRDAENFRQQFNFRQRYHDAAYGPIDHVSGRQFQICKFCGQELKTDESKAREENSRTIENRLRAANNLNPP